MWIKETIARRTELSVILLKKRAANCSNQVTTVRKLKLLPTHKQKHYFVVSTPGLAKELM